MRACLGPTIICSFELLLLILDGSAVVTSSLADVDDGDVFDGTTNASDAVMELTSTTAKNRHVKEETMLIAPVLEREVQFDANV
jgi:hypothetical protein